MPHLYNTALLIGAALSAIAALLHIWVIAAGPRGYRLCGAGDRFIKAAEAGKKFPAVVTAGIALVLFIWSLYALSGAGLIAPLLLRPALLSLPSSTCCAASPAPSPCAIPAAASALSSSAR